MSHYAGGIREWRRANLRFDTGRERSVRPEERSPLMRMEEGEEEASRSEEAWWNPT